MNMARWFVLSLGLIAEMTPVTPPDENIRRIVAALGLERCHALTLRMALNECVSVTAEQYADKLCLDQLATVLESREYVLVPKAKAKEFVESMEQFIAMTDPWQGALCTTPIVGKEANAARKAFFNLKRVLK